MKSLLEAGVHFGHQTRRWNPKMKKYIYTERNGIHIIDLEQSLDFIDKAYGFVKDVSTKGGMVLFVGTKKQAQEGIREQADRCDMPYVNQRWLGGTLTNFVTIKERLRRLEELEKKDESDDWGGLPKKTILQLKREKEKLAISLGGLRRMNKLPDIMFVIDGRKEALAIKEGRKLGTPIIGLIDTNSDPDDVDYIIPGNDDAIRSVNLIARVIADAVMEGKAGSQAVKDAEAAAAETAAAEAPTSEPASAEPASAEAPSSAKDPAAAEAPAGRTAGKPAVETK
ncbi:MAG: 30S ribosomal protein S2 [Actinomycetota bacterium]